MSEPTPADVLRQAAAVIREKGWCRERLHDGLGRSCAAGAITEAVNSALASRDCLPLYLDTLAAMHRGVGRPDLTLPQWNDHYAIDAEDVAQHMEKAAALYEETAGLADSSSTAGAYPAAPPRL